jgi:hypothetical protein
MSTTGRKRRQRTGAVTLEFILLLPILVLLLLAMGRFAVALVMREAVTHAATVGAREAGKGEDTNEVALVVDGILEQGHALNLADDAGGIAQPVEGSGVRVFLEVGQPDAHFRPERADFGDSTIACEPPDTPAVQPDEVRVTVCLDLSTRPMCNWLFGFDQRASDFNGRYCRISSLVKKE